MLTKTSPFFHPWQNEATHFTKTFGLYRHSILDSLFIGKSVDAIMTMAKQQNVKSVRFARWILWKDGKIDDVSKEDLLLTINKGYCVAVQCLPSHS